MDVEGKLMDATDALEVFEVGDFKLAIYSDDDPQDPRDNDNLGTMVSWHRRARLGDRTIKSSEFSNMEELEASFEAKICLPLYLYEHSGMTMRTWSFNDPWDSGQVGFIYATADVIRKNFGIAEITPEVEDRVREILEAEVAEYDQYLRGDVYGYVLTGKDGEHVDSCWGFFGLEHVRGEAKSVLEAITKEEG